MQNIWLRKVDLPQLCFLSFLKKVQDNGSHAYIEKVGEGLESARFKHYLAA